MTVFTFREDPGHGWLIVTRAQLAAVGLSEADITHYSYADPHTDKIGLEEDFDALTFHYAWLIKHDGIPFETRTEQTGSEVRHSWGTFGTRVNDETSEARTLQLRDAAIASRKTASEA